MKPTKGYSYQDPEFSPRPAGLGLAAPGGGGLGWQPLSKVLW